MHIDNNEWVITYKRIKLLLFYYVVLLALSIFSVIFILTSNLDINRLILTLVGSIGFSIIGNSIYYIRKIYKLCIQSKINEPNIECTSKVCQLGYTVYFFTRPLFATAFAILIVIGLNSGMIVMTTNTVDLSNGFTNLAMFICFFCGFSSGKFVEKIGEKGESLINSIFESKDDKNA